MKDVTQEEDNVESSNELDTTTKASSDDIFVSQNEKQTGFLETDSTKADKAPTKADKDNIGFIH